MAKRGNPNWKKGGPSPNPSGKRLDAFVNEYTGHGTADDASQFTRHVTRPVSEQEAIDLRRGNWLAKRIVELRPEDCFRKGYTIKTDDKDTSERLMAMLEAACVSKKLVAAGQMEATVGGAALFPVLDGAIGDLAEPLDLDDSPRLLSVKAIHLLESRELQPESWYDDITHPKFRRPERYRLCALSGGGSVRTTHVVIHESRLAVFPGIQVSSEPQPGQPWGWGDSKLTPIRDVIHNFGLSWGSVAAILRNFGERIIKIADLNKILAARGGEAALAKRLRFADRFRSTLRGQVFSADDEVETLLDSTTGLPDLLLQLAQVVSAAAGEPMTRLFGMSPGGMNATGEYDQQMAHELIANEQAQKYTEPLEWLIRLFMLCADSPTGGREPDVWSIEWKPLKQQSELEIAQTRKLVAEADEKYYAMGLPAERLLQDRFGGDTFSMETTFDAAEFRAQQEEEQRLAEEMRAAERAAAEGEPGKDDETEAP